MYNLFKKYKFIRQASVLLLASFMLIGTFGHGSEILAANIKTDQSSQAAGSGPGSTIQARINEWRGYLPRLTAHLKQVAKDYGPYGFVLERETLERFERMLDDAEMALRNGAHQEAKKLINALENAFDQFLTRLYVMIDKGDRTYLEKEFIPDIMPGTDHIFEELSQRYDLADYLREWQSIKKHILALAKNWPSERARGHNLLTELFQKLYKLQIKVQERIVHKDQRHEEWKAAVSEWLEFAKAYFREEEREIRKSVELGFIGSKNSLDELLSHKPTLNSAVKNFEGGKIAESEADLTKLYNELFAPWSEVIPELIEAINGWGNDLANFLVNSNTSVRNRIDAIAKRGIDVSKLKERYEADRAKLEEANQAAARWCSTYAECGPTVLDKKGWVSGLNEVDGFRTWHFYTMLESSKPTWEADLKDYENRPDPKNPQKVWWLIPNFKGEYDSGQGGIQDFNQMFTDQGWNQWSDVRQNVKTFVFYDMMFVWDYPEFSSANDQYLRNVFRRLRESGINVGVYANLYAGGNCEYRGADAWLDQVGAWAAYRRMKDLGADVRYIMFDSALSAAVSTECGNQTYEQAAREFARFGQRVRGLFPEVKLVQTDNYTPLHGGELSSFDVEEWRQWLPVLKRHAGDYVEYISLDINDGGADYMDEQSWSTFRWDGVPRIEEMARANDFKVLSEQIPTRLVFTEGDPFTAEANREFFWQGLAKAGEMWAGGSRPDDESLTSWVRVPMRALPDSSGMSFTHLAKELMLMKQNYDRITLRISADRSRLSPGESTKLKAFMDFDGPQGPRPEEEVTDFVMWRSEDVNSFYINYVERNGWHATAANVSPQTITVRGRFGGKITSMQINIVE